jgi:hypothetical protein
MEMLFSTEIELSIEKEPKPRFVFFHLAIIMIRAGKNIQKNCS